MPRGKGSRLLTVRAEHGRDRHSWNGGRGASMRVADVARAENPDVHLRRRCGTPRGGYDEPSGRIRILRYQMASPWSCSRMWPFCLVPNRATSLNLLSCTAAYNAGLSNSY